MNDSPHEDRQQARADKVSRTFLGATRGLTIYGLLIGGSIIFTLPFIWMIGTSFKVDREMFSEKITLLPGKPIPAQHSPYLDERFYTLSDQTDFDRVKTAIESKLTAMDLGVPEHLQGKADKADVVKTFVPGIFKRLKQTVPLDAWKQDDSALSATVAEKISSEMVNEVERNIFRNLSFGTVRVRSFDVQEKSVTEGKPVSSFWSIDAGPAKFVENTEAATEQADLVYNFSKPDKQTVELSSMIELPFPAERLHRVQIGIKPDDSWHAFKFYVEKNGKKYESMKPEYLSNFQPKVLTLQEFGPDDAPDSNKIKLWTPYKEIASGDEYDHGPNRTKVSVVMKESSQANAWWAKCTRNYREAMNYIPFWRYAATSAFLVILNIVGNIFACSLAAYAFARLHWPGRNLSFGLMLATMMIPPQVTMIPYFLIIKHLGWYGTLKPLWVISFFGNAFNIFLLRQFMKGIPRDLEDAAKIDGCHFMQIYWHVIMPLIKPTLACIAIFTFMGVWNDFMGPLIYLADQRLYPLSLGLYAFNVQKGGDYGMMMAGSLLMTLPVILIFFFAQKYFIQGITLTGVKG